MSPGLPPIVGKFTHLNGEYPAVDRILRSRSRLIAITRLINVFILIQGIHSMS